MSAGFTPGPWEYRDLKDGWGIFPASVSRKNWSDDQVICGGEVDYDPLWLKEPAEANARLIAAAPELFKALSELRDWAQATAPHGNCGKPLGCITCGFIENADAALAKAVGQ